MRCNVAVLAVSAVFAVPSLTVAAPRYAVHYGGTATVSDGSPDALVAGDAIWEIAGCDSPPDGSHRILFNVRKATYSINGVQGAEFCDDLGGYPCPSAGTNEIRFGSSLSPTYGTLQWRAAVGYAAGTISMYGSDGSLDMATCTLTLPSALQMGVPPVDGSQVNVNHGTHTPTYYNFTSGSVSVRAAPPALTSISPDSVEMQGGATVTIGGANFQPGATVTIGGVVSPSVAVVSDTQIQATAPPHQAPEFGDVVVTNPDGQSATGTNWLGYLGALQVLAITPTSGPAAGGTRIQVDVRNVRAGCVIALGGNTLLNCPGAEANARLYFETPPHAPGPADLVATNPDGSTSTIANAFTYTAAPAVASVSPPDARATGGGTVTVSGSGFVSGASVTLGGTAAQAVTFVDANTLTAVIPAHAQGVVDVIVTNPDNQSGTLATAFGFRGPLTIDSISPRAAPSNQGVPISGWVSNLGSGGKIFLGDALLFENTSNAYIGRSGQFSGGTPTHAPGTVDIIAKNPDGETYTIPGGFTWDNAGGGTNVSAVPVDPATGQAAPMALTFSNVTSPGVVQATTTATAPSSVPPVPAGNFTLGSPAVYYDISTTATFAGPVQVCIDFSAQAYSDPSSIRLFHYENGAWTDVTTSVNTTTQVVCGSVTSFSPFTTAVKPQTVQLIVNGAGLAGTIRLNDPFTALTILGTRSLDVKKVDPASLRLNGVSVLADPKTGKSTLVADVDRDGIPDLIVAFQTSALKLTTSSKSVKLTGTRTAGPQNLAQGIVGTAPVTVKR